VPIRLEENKERCSIHLEDEINIACARELKNLLLQGLASGKDLSVELERATELDVTAMQLLFAAEREARKLEVGFSIAGRVPDQISIAVVDAGFEKFPVPLEPK
jgi:anti-anti-sigma regulatory factor